MLYFLKEHAVKAKQTAHFLQKGVFFSLISLEVCVLQQLISPKFLVFWTHRAPPVENLNSKQKNCPIN